MKQNQVSQLKLRLRFRTRPVGLRFDRAIKVACLNSNGMRKRLKDEDFEARYLSSLKRGKK